MNIEKQANNLIKMLNRLKNKNGDYDFYLEDNQVKKIEKFIRQFVNETN